MVYKEVLSTPLIPQEKGVWTMFGEATIEAPAKVVYAAIRDFDSYAKWNEYMPHIKRPSGTNEISVDDMITLDFRMGPGEAPMEVPCRVTAVSDDEMMVSWQGLPSGIPTMIFLGEKVNRVISKGDNECVVQIFETQAKPMAYVIKWAMGQKLSRATQGIADGLKRYVEGQVKGDE